VDQVADAVVDALPEHRHLRVVDRRVEELRDGDGVAGRPGEHLIGAVERAAVVAEGAPPGVRIGRRVPPLEAEQAGGGVVVAGADDVEGGHAEGPVRRPRDPDVARVDDPVGVAVRGGAARELVGVGDPVGVTVAAVERAGDQGLVVVAEAVAAADLGQAGPLDAEPVRAVEVVLAALAEPAGAAAVAAAVDVGLGAGAVVVQQAVLTRRGAAGVRAVVAVVEVLVVTVLAVVDDAVAAGGLAHAAAADVLLAGPAALDVARGVAAVALDVVAVVAGLAALAQPVATPGHALAGAGAAGERRQQEARVERVVAGVADDDVDAVYAGADGRAAGQERGGAVVLGDLVGVLRVRRRHDDLGAAEERPVDGDALTLRVERDVAGGLQIEAGVRRRVVVEKDPHRVVEDVADVLRVLLRAEDVGELDAVVASGQLEVDGQPDGVEGLEVRDEAPAQVVGVAAQAVEPGLLVAQVRGQRDAHVPRGEDGAVRDPERAARVEPRGGRRALVQDRQDLDPLGAEHGGRQVHRVGIGLHLELGPGRCGQGGDGYRRDGDSSEQRGERA